jgi:hypothetical protein
MLSKSWRERLETILMSQTCEDVANAEFSLIKNQIRVSVIISVLIANTAKDDVGLSPLTIKYR